MHEEGLMSLSFVRNNPFFKKDAEKRMSASYCGGMDTEKRMSASFCGGMSLVSETVLISDGESSIKRRNRINQSNLSSRSRSAANLTESKEQVIVNGVVVKLRSPDTMRRRQELASRRETVEILMEEIVRENRKVAEEEEARAASSGSDLEYGPGIVEKLKAKFARISTGDSKKKQKHKRYRSVDDILDNAEYTTYVPPETVRCTQTLDRSPCQSSSQMSHLSRRTSRSMAELGLDDEGDRRAFSLQRPSRRTEYEQEEEQRHRLSVEADDMVDIKELRRLFDRPAENGAAMWRPMEPRRERFIERGRTHQTVPPNVRDASRDVPPPRELRLSAPCTAINLDHDDERPIARAVPLKKVSVRRDFDRSEVAAPKQDDEPEFVRIGRRLRRATVDVKLEQSESEVLEEKRAADAEVSAITNFTPSVKDALTIVTSPPDPAPVPESSFISPPSLRRGSLQASDVTPPPEEPKPPMRPASDIDSDVDTGSRYNSMARSESSHVPYSDASLPRSETSTVSSRTASLQRGGVASRSTSSERRAYAKIVPENQDTSGVEEMQRLLNRFNERKKEEEEQMRREKEEAERAEQRLLEAESRRTAELKRTELSKDTELAREPESDKELEQDRETERKRAELARQVELLDAELAAASELLTSREVVLPPREEPMKSRFVPAIVGIRSSDGRQLLSPTMSPTSTPTIAAEMCAPGLNVVSISVRDFAPSVIYTNEEQHQQQRRCDDDDSDVRRSSVGSSASSTTSSGCSSEDVDERPSALPPRKESLESASRKSLSALFFEERSRDSSPFSDQTPPPLPPRNHYKPYGDEAIMTSASTTKTSEDTVVAPMSKVELPAEESACVPPSELHESEPELEPEAQPEPEIVEIDEEEVMEMVEPKTDDVIVVEDEVIVELSQVRREEHDDADTDSELDTDDDGEIEDIANRQLRLSLSALNCPLVAGDGNPVRHSLLQLAMEEDLPLLLEAMNETYNFEFEDIDTTRASTSIGGCLRSANSRTKVKRSITIEHEATGAYTYLDEISAETEDHWRSGAAVTIQEYRSMVESAAAEEEAAYMRSLEELARWNASIAVSTADSGSTDPMGSHHVPLVFST